MQFKAIKAVADINGFSQISMLWTDEKYSSNGANAVKIFDLESLGDLVLLSLLPFQLLFKRFEIALRLDSSEHSIQRVNELNAFIAAYFFVYFQTKVNVNPLC